MSFFGRLHDQHVHSRRVRVLCDLLSKLIPRNVSVLDVGCGDGLLAKLIAEQRPDIQINGIEILVRPDIQIPVTRFVGKSIPFGDKSFDIVMFVDVLHHTKDPLILLNEAIRVARAGIVIKDHTRNGFLAGATLRFMDCVGNARHHVALPYNYWPRHRWFQTFDLLELTACVWKDKLNLYPSPASYLFDRSLHFVTRLESRTCRQKEKNLKMAR
jgi:SAM-dependent methyltransferase